ncbi:MAG: Eco57I restriction-modification methylase domain-containing protein [Bacteroidales bacterium]|nr:Eco57I restriction-modification methylase domain-containing protein [Bacteroidales bacterium]
MKEKDLKNILREDFNFEKNWKPIFSLLFNKVQYFTNPSNPFEEQSKVKSGKQTGLVKLDDGKSLAIFEVEVDDSIYIDRNRQGLREIAIKHIDQNITHGALVFFYSKNQVDYRFSFIAKWSEIDLETGAFIKGETKPKRYTYLLGDNEACTTAAKRLLVLAKKKENQEIGIKEVIDAFAVEPLKNDFFKTYKEHYEKFWRYLANPENGFRNILLDTDTSKAEEKREKPIRDFVKKLLGRIVFLHFLQKKAWMGCTANSKEWIDGDKKFMQNLYSEFQDKQKFHSKCLTKLFFNTLNTIRDNDLLEIKGLKGKLNGSRVPYLNGGLFDADKPEETKNIDFPEKFFFDLLDFFEQYNFTIDENSPDDHEVGIDPEMLGHIFENLLEENREKGAFYTPKEVVQYMCKESLIEYLKNHFKNADAVANFVRNHAVSGFFAERDNAVELNDKLNAIKVCDPAIGSGAFPIGMLQEIFEAKKFIYPYLRTNKEFNPAQVKKDIIQNSIYGVDLEKGAVDIAQLRFWLALVVDESKPQPLPNLDYKIMQGNSLLESYEGIDLSKAALFDEPKVRIIEPDLFREPDSVYGFSDKNRVDIKQLISDYFKVEDKNDKANIRKQIDKIVTEHIDKSLEGYENQLLIEIAGLESTLKRKKDLLQNTVKTEKEIENRKKLLTQKGEARKKLLDFEKTDERPYFLWHLFFMDVFEPSTGSGGGFDVMIGNPPYIQLQKMGEEADILQKEGFETFTRTGDIYCLFYEKGFKLLKPHGNLTFITSNKWMRGGYGKALRNYFTKINPLKILILGPGIFHSATVDTNIFIGKNDSFNNNVEGIEIKNRFEISSLEKEDFIPLKDVNENAWIVLNEEELLINKAFEKFGKPLKDWDIKINFGIKTGFNEAFIIDQAKRDELVAEDKSSDSIIRPILKGREIQRYHVEWKDDYIINTHNGVKELDILPIDIEKYPAIKKHLNAPKLWEKVNKRQDQGITPYNLRNCAYLFEFKKEKVIWKRIGSIMRFAYSDEEIYCLDSTCIATGEKIKYLTAVLNSKAGLYQLFKTSPQTGTGDQIISVQALEPFLVHYPNEANEKKFDCLVDYILFIKKSPQNIMENISNELLSSVFEEIIDFMVYELYFEKHTKDNEIDVLKFVDFEDISQLESFEEKRDVIQKAYYKLKEKDNPIRNRILVSESRSSIIKRINETTH